MIWLPNSNYFDSVGMGPVVTNVPVAVPITSGRRLKSRNTSDRSVHQLTWKGN